MSEHDDFPLEVLTNSDAVRAGLSAARQSSPFCSERST